MTAEEKAQKEAEEKAQAEAEAKKKAEEEAKKSSQSQPSGSSSGESISKAEYDRLLHIHLEMKEKYAKREAEDKKKSDEALAEQGKFKDLYDAAKKELDALKPLYEKFEKALKTFLDAEVNALDPAVKELLPGNDPVEQLNWISKAKEKGVIGKTKDTKEKAKGDGAPAAGGGGAAKFADIYKKK